MLFARDFFVWFLKLCKKCTTVPNFQCVIWALSPVCIIYILIYIAEYTSRFYLHWYWSFLLDKNKDNQQNHEDIGHISYTEPSPPRWSSPCRVEGAYPRRSSNQSASMRRAQLSIAAKVVRPTDLLKNVRYWFIID